MYFLELINGVPTSVGGSGELNLVNSPSTAAGWTAATGATLATTTTAGDLPLGTLVPTAIKITSGTGTSTEGTLAQTNYYSFTTPAAYAVKTKVEVWQRPGTNFIANEWTVSVYAGSTRQALTTDASSVTYIPNANGKFTTYFDAAASTAYTVRFTRVNNAGANAGVLNVANVIVGPGIQPQGAVVGPWKSYTPTVTNLGAGSSTNEGWYRQVGESIEVKIRVLKDATPGSGGSAVTMTLPPNYTLNSGAVTSNNQVGWGNFSGATYTGAAQAFAGGNLLQLRKVGGSTNILGSDMTASSELDFAGLMVPVNELAGSGTVNLAQNDVEYAANASTAGAADVNTVVDNVLGPNGALVPTFTSNAANGGWNRYIEFPTSIQVGDSFIVEIQHLGVGSWIPVPSGHYAMGLRQGAAYYGFHIYEISSTVINLAIGAGGPQATNATYGATAGNWPVGSGDRYRVRKVKSGQAVGFGVVNPGTSSGLVAAAGLPGNTTGNAIAAGYVGEVIRSTAMSNTTISTSATDVTGSNLPLPPGCWHIFYSIEGEIDSGSSSGDRSLGSLAVYTSGNVKLAQTDSRVAIKTTSASIAIANGRLSGSTVVNLSSATTYKLQGTRTDLSGTGVFTVITAPDQAFYAVRIA